MILSTLKKGGAHRRRYFMVAMLFSSLFFAGAASADALSTPSTSSTPSAASSASSAATNPSQRKQGLPKPTASRAVPLDGIVAIVNDEIITQSQWQQAVTAARNQLRASRTAIPARSQLRHQVLNQLILSNIQAQMAKKAGINITSAQVSAAIERVARQNHATVDQMRAQIEASGMSFPAYRRQIKQQMQMMQLQQMAVGKSINVSAQEIDVAMRQLKTRRKLAYHLGDILVALPENPTTPQVQKARAKAMHILRQLQRSGANFKKIAAAQSDSAQAFKGGDMGWMTVTDMPQVFVAVVSKLPIGGVSQPLRAPNGFHLLKLFGRRAEGKGPTRQQVANQLRQRKFQENLAIWLQQLRDSAYVKVLVPGYKQLGS